MIQPEPNILSSHMGWRQPGPPRTIIPAVASHAYGEERARLEQRSAGRCGASPPMVFHDQPPRSDADCCALSAGHAGWHRNGDGCEWSRQLVAEIAAQQDRLTVEQEIRARALRAVVALEWYVDTADLDTAAWDVLALADRFAAYITTGANPPAAEIVDDDPASTMEATDV